MRVIGRRAVHYIPALLVGIAYARLNGFFDPLGSLAGDTKVTMYQTFAGIAGTVLGLGFVSFSVLFAVSPGSRLGAVVAYSPVLRAWLTSTFGVLGVALLGFGVLLPLDSTDDATPARFVAAGLVVAVAIALADLIFLANRTFRTLSRQVEAEMERRPTDEMTVSEPDDSDFQLPVT